MANNFNTPPKAGPLDVAVALLLDHIHTMMMIGLLNLQPAQHLVHSYMSQKELSESTRKHATVLFRDIRALREKQQAERNERVQRGSSAKRHKRPERGHDDKDE